SVLDENGTVIAVNRASRDFAASWHSADLCFDVGADYLTMCNSAPIVHGIRDVLRGRRDRFDTAYESRDAYAERWLRITVTRFLYSGRPRAVVALELLDEAVGSRADLDFEQLVAELSTTFARVPTDQIDRQIELALERIGNALELDRAT